MRRYGAVERWAKGQSTRACCNGHDRFPTHKMSSGQMNPLTIARTDKAFKAVVRRENKVYRIR